MDISAVEADPEDLHVLLFPLVAKGHMIPALDMAKMFSARGVRCTVVTTPLNAPFFRRGESATISVVTVPFPSEQVDLPAGIESLDAIAQPDHHAKFFRALALLEPALDGVLAELRPDAVVIDVFFGWAPDLARKYGVPWLAFWGTGFCAMCCMDNVARYKPFNLVSSDDEPFVLEGLPDRFELVRAQLPESLMLGGGGSEFTKIIERVSKVAERSQGMIVNSFYELEPAYADHYRNVLGQKAWHVGPVSLCREKDSTDGHDCLKWLDSKSPDSVVFMCFGTNVNFSADQLREIAAGLEASGQDFVWVVSKKSDDVEGCDWLPEGFEDRTRGRGVIVRGWAPQVLILGHPAVGGFVTHCGWNSVLEGVSAGVPMVTWPIFAEQFYNEKLIVQVLGTGVGVGTRRWVPLVGDFVTAEQVSRAVAALMVGDGSAPMRARAKALGEAARDAVKEGGSSYSDLGSLIEFVKSTKKN